MLFIIISGMVNEWTEAAFESLDVELLNAQTMKYAKAVNQLEKGLPPNGLVPQLKDRVEGLRDKVRSNRTCHDLSVGCP